MSEAWTQAARDAVGRARKAQQAINDLGAGPPGKEPQVAETATEPIRVTPSTKALLEARQQEFWQAYRVRASMDAVIRQALADRKQATP